MPTVNEYMQQHLNYCYDMSWKDGEACLEFVIPEIHRMYQNVLNTLVPGVNDVEAWRQEMVQVDECWDKDIENYSDEWRESLERKVERKALLWCVQRLNTLETTLQEIHRLSGTMSLQQEPQKAEIGPDWLLQHVLKNDKENSNT